MSDAAPETYPPAYVPPPSEIKRGRGCLFWLALLTSIIAFGPIVSAMLAGIIAQNFGCVLNEAGAHPCIIAGQDWGELLAGMFVMGWLMLLTIWLVPVALGLWLWWLIAWFRRPRA